MQIVKEDEVYMQKVIEYKNPGVKLGHGKYHAIELIIYKGDLYALKKIPKATIDKQKRIEHLKNEKKVCQLMQKVAEFPDFFIRLEETFTDIDSINFIFDFMPGQDLYWVMHN